MHSTHSRTRARSVSFDPGYARHVRRRPVTNPTATRAVSAAASGAPDAEDATSAPDAQDNGAGLGLANETQGGPANADPAVPASPAATELGSDWSDAETNAGGAESNQSAAAAAAAAAPVLKIGGKALHETLGTVTIIQMGPMGARVEFFSVSANALKERNVMLNDLTPLPDEDSVSGDDAGAPADVDNDDPLQARAAALRTLRRAVALSSLPCPSQSRAIQPYWGNYDRLELWRVPTCATAHCPPYLHHGVPFTAALTHARPACWLTPPPSPCWLRTRAPLGSSAGGPRWSSPR